MRYERHPGVIEELIQKGNDRIDIIEHYGIAAPKLHHLNEIEVEKVEVDDDLEEAIAEAMSTNFDKGMDLDHLKRTDLRG